MEDGGIEAGVDEGSEEHVATDAGEAVEVGDAHGVIVSWVAAAEGEVSAPASLRDDGVPGLVRCGGVVTDPTIPCGLRPSGIMGHPCAAKDFHVTKDADRYRLLAFPIPLKSRPTL